MIIREVIKLGIVVLIVRGEQERTLPEGVVIDLGFVVAPQPENSDVCLRKGYGYAGLDNFPLLFLGFYRFVLIR